MFPEKKEVNLILRKPFLHICTKIRVCTKPVYTKIKDID